MRKVLLIAAVSALVASSWGTATASSNGSASGRTAIASSHPRWAVPADRVADVNPSSAVVIRVYLKGADDSGLEAVARAVSDPKSASYRHFLTPAELHARYAPTAATVNEVRTWLKGSGLTLLGQPSNNLYVEASGSAAQIASTFGVKLGNYRVHGMELRAADRDLTIPSSVASAVSGVIGVDQSESLLQPKHIAADPSAAAPAGFRNAPPCSAYWGEKLDTTDPHYGGGYASPLPYVPCGYKPAQLRSVYGLGSYVDQGHTGASATVAIIDAYASPTIFADASTYAQRNDPAHPLLASQFSQKIFKPNQKLAGANQCDATGWWGEETLDVEAVHAMAPGAHILYVGGRDCNDTSLDVALNSVVSDHLAQIVSNSYGDLGEDIPASVAVEFERIAQQAAAEGIGLYFSSGDNGDEVSTLGSPAADFSATSPWVTAVGGTSLGIGATGARVLETGWETGKSILNAGAYSPAPPGAFLYGSGGGKSTVFAEPDYQRGVVPDALARVNSSFHGRVVPDISMDGDPNTGFLVGQTQKFPAREGGVQYSEYRIGGTSLSAPLFAGLMALADDSTGSPHGFINPTLYSLSGSSSIIDVLHAKAADVRVDYLNGINASQGTVTSVRTFDFRGLTIKTQPGYDNTTGLGVPNGVTFLGKI
ncbi:MAG TPA: S53 family peptidase [Acidimicrobiia bacterium]|nr:S53 family peptidase [Acidimicrobiia bacterium]